VTVSITSWGRQLTCTRVTSFSIHSSLLFGSLISVTFGISHSVSRCSGWDRPYMVDILYRNTEHALVRQDWVRFHRKSTGPRYHFVELICQIVVFSAMFLDVVRLTRGG
jgi:hypothetical protein